MCAFPPASFSDGEVAPENKPRVWDDSMKRRRTRKTTEIEVETQETTLATQRSKPMAAWCPGCARESTMETPEGAARLAAVTVRRIYQWVEAAEVHFTETPEGMLICLSSLIRRRAVPH